MIGRKPANPSKGIIKIQRPLFTSDPEQAMALIYNEDRSLNVMVPFGADIAELFDDEDTGKRYWLADWSQDNIELIEEVGEQDW